MPGAGVENAKNLVDWPAYATGGLQDAAVAAGHPPGHLAKHFAGRKTIYVCSSYSGMGTFEPLSTLPNAWRQRLAELWRTLV